MRKIQRPKTKDEQKDNKKGWKKRKEKKMATQRSVEKVTNRWQKSDKNWEK